MPHFHIVISGENHPTYKMGQLLRWDHAFIYIGLDKRIVTVPSELSHLRWKIELSTASS